MMPSASAAAEALRIADVEDATPISQQSRWLAQQMHEAEVVDRSRLEAGKAGEAGPSSTQPAAGDTSRTISRIRQTADEDTRV